VISALGLAGLALSIILAVAQYFGPAGLVASLTTVVACGYTLAAPPVNHAKIADVRAAASGFILSVILVIFTLLVVLLRNGYVEPLIVPAALLQDGIPLLVAPIFSVPLAFRVWRKHPDRL
jgi:uncharacterized membrane protein